MPTKLLYFENQNLFQTETGILEIIYTENLTALVLNETIFYVQGGGQPSDTGTIFTESSTFIVEKVIYDENGKVLHIGKFTNPSFEINSKVNLKIDTEKRQLHSKIHSAGHLIDLAIKNVGLSWIPGKGFHYPHGSYVEYSNIQSLPDLEKVEIRIQNEFDDLVAKNIPVLITFDDKQIYKNQTLRKMSFGGLGEIPCGGTHVLNTSDLASFEIKKIKVKGNVAKVSYGLKN